MRVVLSFDVEEFDMPIEFGGNPDLNEQLQTSNEGLNLVLPLLEKYQAISTIYCTGVYAKSNPEMVKKMSVLHEIASHNYFHSSHKKEDLLASKKLLEEISNQNVIGFRMPRMAPVSDADLTEAGYKYNASLNPTYLPGRYDNRHISRTFFIENNLMQFPSSVSPKFRIPLFWIAFHNFPLWFFFRICKRVLKTDGYLHLYFHPWEFTEYTHSKNGAKYPFYLHRNNGEKMLKRFDKLLTFLQKQNCVFETSSQFLKL